MIALGKHQSWLEERSPEKLSTLCYLTIFAVKYAKLLCGRVDLIDHAARNHTNDEWWLCSYKSSQKDATNLKRSSLSNRFQLSIKLKLPTLLNFRHSKRSKRDAMCAQRRETTSVSSTLTSLVSVFRDSSECDAFSCADIMMLWCNHWRDSLRPSLCSTWIFHWIGHLIIWYIIQLSDMSPNLLKKRILTSWLWKLSSCYMLPILCWCYELSKTSVETTMP